MSSNVKRKLIVFYTHSEFFPVTDKIDNFYSIRFQIVQKYTLFSKNLKFTFHLFKFSEAILKMI